jgi:hypothetical protein
MAAFSRGRPVGLFVTFNFCSGTRSILPRAFLPLSLLSSQMRLLSRSAILQETSEQKAERMLRELKEKRMRHQILSVATRKEQADAAQMRRKFSKRQMTQAQASSTSESGMSAANAMTSESTFIETLEQPNAGDSIRTLNNLPMREYKPTILSSTSSHPSIKSMLASGKEMVIYMQPRPGRRSFTLVCALVTAYFGIMVICLIAYAQALIESGFMPNSVTGLAWTITGCFLVGMMYASYSARTGLVEKISLVPRYVGSKPRLMARVEGRGVLPWSKTTSEVPYEQVRVQKYWEDIEQPRTNRFSRPLAQIPWFFRMFAYLSLPFKSLWHQLRYRLTRQTFMRLWTATGKETVWNSWLIDATGLISKERGMPLNDADGRLSPSLNTARFRLT